MYNPKEKRQYHNLSIQGISDPIYHLIVDASELKRIPLNQEINEVLLNEFQPRYVFQYSWQYVKVTKIINEIVNQINLTSKFLHKIKYLVIDFRRARIENKKVPIPVNTNEKFNNNVKIDFQISFRHLAQSTHAFLKFNRRFKKEFNLTGHMYNQSYSKSTYRHLQRIAIRARQLKANQGKIKKPHHLTVRMPEHLYTVLKTIDIRNNHVGFRAMIEAAVISSPTVPHLILPNQEASRYHLSVRQQQYQAYFEKYYAKMVDIRRISYQARLKAQSFLHVIYNVFKGNPHRIIYDKHIIFDDELADNVDYLLTDLNTSQLSNLVQLLNNLKLKEK